MGETPFLFVGIYKKLKYIFASKLNIYLRNYIDE